MALGSVFGAVFVVSLSSILRAPRIGFFMHLLTSEIAIAEVRDAIYKVADSAASTMYSTESPNRVSFS
ncbi:hypothetical protein CPB97_004916 [Podila verticillata]|nr:hypothetical protein CPB97_004916 [Podila verticillata]